jgi:5-methylthioadenosine/S-adenosylhomocysteine deaminase
MNSILIKSCDVLQRIQGEYQISPEQDIYIENSRIRKISPSNSDSKSEKYEIINANGMLAIPGLINTHAHVPMVLLREFVSDVRVETWFNDYIWHLESNLTPEDIYWGALLGHAEMIENGITCVADRYFHMDEVARAVSDSGIRANLVWTIFGHEDEDKLNRTIKFIHDWQGSADGRITTWMGPHAPYTCGPDFLQRIGKIAQDMNVGIHIHVSETEEQVNRSINEHGITPVKMLEKTGILTVPTILGHCSYPKDDDIRILAGVDAGVAHAPKTYLKFGGGIVNLKRFQDANIPVGLATDGAASNSTLDIFEQLRITAMLQKYISNDATRLTVGEALGIAFEGGGKVMKLGHEIGDLAPGKLADIVLMKMDGLHNFPPYNPLSNLVYTVKPGDIDTVICNGDILYSGGKHISLDKAQIIEECKKRLTRVTDFSKTKRIATYPD